MNKNEATEEMIGWMKAETTDFVIEQALAIARGLGPLSAATIIELCNRLVAKNEATKIERDS